MVHRHKRRLLVRGERVVHEDADVVTDDRARRSRQNRIAEAGILLVELLVALPLVCAQRPLGAVVRQRLDVQPREVVARHVRRAARGTRAIEPRHHRVHARHRLLDAHRHHRPHAAAAHRVPRLLVTRDRLVHKSAIAVLRQREATPPRPRLARGDDPPVPVAHERQHARPDGVWPLPRVRRHRAHGVGQQRAHVVLAVGGGVGRVVGGVVVAEIELRVPFAREVVALQLAWARQRLGQHAQPQRLVRHRADGLPPRHGQEHAVPLRRGVRPAGGAARARPHGARLERGEEQIEQGVAVPRVVQAPARLVRLLQVLAHLAVALRLVGKGRDVELGQVRHDALHALHLAR